MDMERLIDLDFPKKDCFPAMWKLEERWWLNCIHPQQICGRTHSPCIPSKVRAATMSNSQSPSVLILSFLSFTPASQLRSC